MTESPDADEVMVANELGINLVSHAEYSNAARGASGGQRPLRNSARIFRSRASGRVHLVAGELLILIGLTCDANRPRRVPTAPEPLARTHADQGPLSNGICHR